MIGRRIGVYEITAAIGAGGMGEVYRARDTRLGRDVAIKVLPDAVTRDGERVARFEREARILASLNHPHIATIHGFEEGAIVMELVEGPALGEERLPLAEALQVARQIADALDAAHEKGVIHRDLKPANVRMTADGTVKVLDFGLARTAASVAGAPADASGIETRADTKPGAIVGTAAYMSPEQARGQAVDKRTDIWAFGCVLYELLTGRQAFAGATFSDTLVAVLEREPDWTALPAATPAPVRRLLRRCLIKDPRERLRDIGDARHDLTVDDTPDTTARRPRQSQWLAWSAAALGIMLAGAAVTWRSRPPSTPVDVEEARFALPLPEGEPLAGALAISPDGRYVAFVTTRGGRPSLYLRALAASEPARIVEAGGGAPFFSPDSRWLAYFEGRILKKVPVEGGPAVTITAVRASRGGTWGDDGFIILAPDARTGLVRVSADGGMVEPLTTLDVAAGETSHRFPHVLPGGRAVVYRNEGATYADGAIAVYSLDTRRQRILVPDGGLAPRYASGHLLFVKDESLMAAPLDLTRLELTGPPVRVVDDVQLFSVSATGTLLFAVRPDAETGRTLVWVDRKGQRTPLPLPPQPYRMPRLSPDGGRLAFALDDVERHIWTYDIARNALARLTFSGANSWPLWSHDGTRLFFGSNRPGTPWDILAVASDGTGTPSAVIAAEGTQVPRDVSPDGSWLAYDADTDVWVAPLRVTGQPHVVAGGPGDQRQPAFSPDGRWIAYVSSESERGEIFVVPADGSPGRWQIASPNGGDEPRWHPNGGELFFREGGKMFAVPLPPGPGFAAGQPTLLFDDASYPLGGVGTGYDVARDGRFLMTHRPRQERTEPFVQVITNWFGELTRPDRGR